MADEVFTADEHRAFEALARRRGFSSLRGYLRTLIKQDAEQHGETVGMEPDAQLDDAFESFKQGWDDAMNGRVVSREEFRRRMLDDAD